MPLSINSVMQLKTSFAFSLIMFIFSCLDKAKLFNEVISSRAVKISCLIFKFYLVLIVLKNDKKDHNFSYGLLMFL
tara:strand:- start:492 stop:719 length:228 start_codon:yes stop_codon:yes gene_type:complete